MSILSAIILGIVEGITEFLPISSTGHMILASGILRLPSTAFLSSFEISIQLGAILSVVVIYFKYLLTQRTAVKNIIIAFIPTAVIGLTAYKFVKTYLFNNQTVVLWALLLGGIGLIIFELLYKEKPAATDAVEKMTVKQSLIIGVVQSLAIIPGVSRAAATIIGGLSLGIKRKTIVEFSFLLAIPTMLAATGLDLLKTGATFSGREWGLLAIGFVVSFLVALLAVKWLLKFIQNHSFISFGIYRIVVAVVFWLMLLK
ncbi:MAG: undecaprenyl-diphosphate phosphatase [Patescibacteria group bacterium]|nr:undecaprenyl-diphosphate phosphatase [Patescibacteria group bacterium]